MDLIESSLSNPVVQLGDVIQPAADPSAIAKVGAEVALNRLFPGDNASLAGDSEKILAELLRSTGNSGSPLLLTVYDGAAPPLAWERSGVLARALGEQARLHPSQIFVQTLPLGGSGTARAEVRILPQEDPGPRAKRSSGP
jgi:hypothetical protein